MGVIEGKLNKSRDVIKIKIFKDSDIEGLESWVFGNKVMEVFECIIELGSFYFLDYEDRRFVCRINNMIKLIYVIYFCVGM